MKITIPGKVLGGLIGVYNIRQMSSRFLIGMIMAPRREVGLIIASIGFQHHHRTH